MRLNCVILVSYDFSYTYVGEWEEKTQPKVRGNAQLRCGIRRRNSKGV
jgi:hypothetical protein